MSLRASLPLITALLLSLPAGAAPENDTRAWVQRAKTGAPETAYSRLGYAGAGKMIVLAGAPGIDNPTWEYDTAGARWTPFARNPSPSRRSRYGIDYDSRRQRAVLFGGSDAGFHNDLWAYDGRTGVWQNVTPTAGAAPRPRSSMIWAYDEKRARFVLFGGTVPIAGTTDLEGIYDTWEWDGTTWTELAPLRRPDSAWQGAYVPTRGRVAAFSTIGTIDEWTGVTWEPVPVIAATLTNGGTFAYAGSGRVLSIGDNAKAGTTDLTAVWETDFRDWWRLAPPTAPTGRSLPMAAYDPARDTLVVAGGLQYPTSDSGPLGFPIDVWEYRYTALDHGSTCDPMQAARCTGGQCVDGVCCASACAGACELCNADTTRGQCTREVSALCPATSSGTGGAPGSGGAPGAGGAMGAGGATMGTGGAIAPVATGGTGGSFDAGPSTPSDSGGARADAAAEVTPAPAKSRGLYAGPACTVGPPSGVCPPVILVALVLLASLRRRRR